jgi:dihydrofolate reductase
VFPSRIRRGQKPLDPLGIGHLLWIRLPNKRDVASRGLGSLGAAGQDQAVRISVFIGTSVDGFIARPNGDLDFLPTGGGEPHGYDEFMANIDALVIGRKTFETVLAYPAWPYGDKRVVVLSSRPLDLSAARGGVVEQMYGPPAEIVSKLAASGARQLYVDGGITIQGFLRAGLVQRFIITKVPVLIGDGIPLFGALPHDIRLRHVATQAYPSGLVKTEYDVVYP